MHFFSIYTLLVNYTEIFADYFLFPFFALINNEETVTLEFYSRLQIHENIYSNWNIREFKKKKNNQTEEYIITEIR